MVGYVLRCGELFFVLDVGKGKDKGVEMFMFVYKFRIYIIMFLMGRNVLGCFVVVCLIKVVVDVGGWESFRVVDFWVCGLISVV